MDDPHAVENRRRSIAMLTTGQPALDREEALEVLAALRDTLLAEAAHRDLLADLDQLLRRYQT